MGTRSVTYFYQEDNKFLVGLYRQMDGYPSGHGRDLYEFLRDYTIVNGLGLKDTGKIANGMGCLSAQTIAHFKTEAGQYYIVTKGYHGQEYEYHVHENDFQLTIKVFEVSERKRKIFDGTLTEFGKFCEKD